MEFDFEWLERKLFARTLTDTEKASFARAAEVVEFAKGETLLMQGVQGDALYLLHSGHVDVLMAFNGQTLRLADVGEGAQIGDMSFLAEEEACATIIARQPCIAYRIRRRDFNALLRHEPTLARDILFGIMSNMSHVLNQMKHRQFESLRYIHHGH